MKTPLNRTLQWLKDRTMPEYLFLSSAFSVILLLARVIITERTHFLFLGWNLFLAWIPFLLTAFLSIRPAWVASRARLLFVACIWLLFLPNSFYIITDLYHLTHISSVPKWFDLLLIFSFAWNGLLLGLLSIRRMEFLLSLSLGKPVSVLVVIAIMWLNAWGIYIGRYLRFNSWDILFNPLSLLIEMTNMLIYPMDNQMQWGMILIYTFFMLVVYYSVAKLSENFNQSINK